MLRAIIDFTQSMSREISPPDADDATGIRVCCLLNEKRNSTASSPVAQSGREYIETTLYRSADSPESILQSASDLISSLTDLASVATTPDGEESRIHKISFVQTGSHTAMAVVIASNGIIKTKLFRCEFLITPEILEVFDKALNKTFSGVKLSSINQPFIQTAAARFGELSLFMPDEEQAAFVRERFLSNPAETYSKVLEALAGEI